MASRAVELAAYRELTHDNISALDLRYFYTYRYTMGNSQQQLGTTTGRLEGFSQRVHQFFAGGVGVVPGHVRAEMEVRVNEGLYRVQKFNFSVPPQKCRY